MEFIEVMKIRNRTCKHYDGDCENCPLYNRNNGRKLFCTDFLERYPEEAEKILSKWAEEHPQKTILMDFLEKYPNAKLDDDGTPEGPCPFHLGYDDDDNCIYGDVYDSCKKCWNRPLEE